MRFPITHIIERDGEELELAVIYDASPEVAATYWQPAEGGEVELVSVKHNGSPFDLTPDEEAALLELCSERVGDDFAQEAADAADYRAEQYEDRLMMAKWEDE